MPSFGPLGQGRRQAEAPRVPTFSAPDGLPPPSGKSRGCLRGLHQNPIWAWAQVSWQLGENRPFPHSSNQLPLPTTNTGQQHAHPEECPKPEAPRASGSNKKREAQRGSAFANVTQHGTAPKTPGARALDRSGTPTPVHATEQSLLQ